MTPKTKTRETFSTILTGRWEQASNKLAALARELPEAKYEAELVDGARTIGEVLRHVAFWNRYVADIVRGKKPDDSANELPKRDYPSKARIVQALEQSASDTAAAIRERPSELEPKMAETILGFIEHISEHYGQIVVYARLNGVIPPASRES